jgi:hypothetical protein
METPMSTITMASTVHPLETPAPAAKPEPSRAGLYAGRGLSGFVVAFLLFDATIKVAQLPIAVSGTTQLGWPASAVFAVGVTELICLALYLIPRTAVLGALLWTGYLGGAIATHARIGSPLVSHTLFPTYVAAMLWLGLWLRDPQLRAVLPLRGSK